jgi:hypothetical protein
MTGGTRITLTAERIWTNFEVRKEAFTPDLSAGEVVPISQATNPHRREEKSRAV